MPEVALSIGCHCWKEFYLLALSWAKMNQEFKSRKCGFRAFAYKHTILPGSVNCKGNPEVNNIIKMIKLYAGTYSEY